jgi:hypothetical protein
MELVKENEVVEAVAEYGSVWKVLAGELPDLDLTDREGLSVSWRIAPFLFGMPTFLQNSWPAKPL